MGSAISCSEMASGGDGAGQLHEGPEDNGTSCEHLGHERNLPAARQPQTHCSR